jgi:hypothetical protein
MAIAPLPPLGFAIATFGLHPRVLGAKPYTQASEAGVSKANPGNGGPTSGLSVSGMNTSMFVWKSFPASPGCATLDFGIMMRPRTTLFCAKAGKTRKQQTATDIIGNFNERAILDLLSNLKKSLWDSLIEIEKPPERGDSDVHN